MWANVISRLELIWDHQAGDNDMRGFGGRPEKPDNATGEPPETHGSKRDAFTIAQFLLPSGRYEPETGRYRTSSAAPADGWSPSHTGAYTYAENTCAQGGALVAALRPSPGRTANTDIATWEFAAPAPESYRALQLASTRFQAAQWRPGGWYFVLW